MRDALASAVVAVLRHSGQPGNLGFGPAQAPVGARWSGVRGGVPCAGGVTFSAAGHAHQARTHGLTRAPSGSASDRRRGRTGHGWGTVRCPCPGAPSGPSTGPSRSSDRVGRESFCSFQRPASTKPEPDDALAGGPPLGFSCGPAVRRSGSRRPQCQGADHQPAQPHPAGDPLRAHRPVQSSAAQCYGAPPSAPMLSGRAPRDGVPAPVRFRAEHLLGVVVNWPSVGLTDDFCAPCWSMRRVPNQGRLTPCGN
jgi:hypothetical protein